MKMRWLKIAVLMLSVAVSKAAYLEYTNITLGFFPNYTNTLRAVAYGVNSNFVAVGDKLATVAGNFTPASTFLTSADWQAGNIANTSWSGTNLFCVASSGSTFLASGGNNLLFVSPDGKSWTTNSSKIFNLSVQAYGMAFNGGHFVAVGASVGNIGYTPTAAVTNGYWTIANQSSESFIESFRGVAPYGTNGFAACGVFGDVRSTTNATGVWQLNAGSVSLPDYYGIATDNKKTIVCVGATNATTSAKQGLIATSTDGGVTWTNSYLVTTNSVNAVAYTGFGFIAVANGGFVYSSTNGLAPWTMVSAPTVAGKANDLNGIAFATGGFMNGVGEIVGASGNVILAAQPPLAPISLGNSWTCVGSPGKLSTSVTNNVVGTNAIVVDWYASAAGGAPLTNSAYNFYPAIQYANTNSTNTYYAEARDLRTGFVSTNRTALVLTNFMRPTISVLYTNAICNGSSDNVQFSLLTGNSPWRIGWTVTWANGSTNFYQYVTNNAGLPVLASLPASPTNLCPNNPTNYTYQVASLIDAYCSGDEAGDIQGAGLITVNPRPTARVITTNTICDGSDFFVQAALTGLGPWTVTWSDGFVQTTNAPVGTGPVLARYIPTGEVHDVFANLQTNFTFTITSVTNADSCMGNQLGDITGVALAYVNPRPKVTGGVAQTICNGGSVGVTLTANLTGIGPWTVTWSDGFVQTTNAPYGSGATVVRGVTANEVTNVLLNLATNYIFTVTSVSNFDTCIGNQPGDLTCTNTVTVNPRPESTGGVVKTICNGDSASVVLTANLTGLSPWTVTWSDGYVQTTNAPVGSGATIVRGVTAAEVTNTLANLTTTNFFTITSVSNADTCTGNQSGDLTTTNIVYVNPRPAATGGVAQTICNGGSAGVTLTASLTGIGPWTVTWSDGFTQTTNAAYGSGATVIRGVTANEVTNVLLNLATNYNFTVTIVSNLDTCLGNPPGDLTCTNTVTVNPRPMAAGGVAQTICNGDSASVTLTANLTGLSPWTVTWSDGYVQTTNAPVGSGATIVRGVTSDEVTNIFANLQTNYLFTVTSISNLDACTGNQPGDLTTTNTVTVNPLPAAFVVQTTNSYITNEDTSVTAVDIICNGGGTAAQSILTGVGPWTVAWSDGLNSYTQTVGSGSGPFTNLLSLPAGGLNPTNQFASAASNFTYTITSVTAAGGCAGSSSGSDVITVNPRPTATVTGSTNIFVDGTNAVSATVQAALTGNSPWVVTWADGYKQTNTTSPAYRLISTNLAGVSYTNYLLTNSFVRKSVVTNTTAGRQYDSSHHIYFDVFTNYVLVTNNVSHQVTTNAFPVQYAFIATNITSSGAAASHLSFTNSVTALSDAHCTAGSSDLTGVAVVNIGPGPAANVFTYGDTNLCPGDQATVQAALSGNSPWVIFWSDGTVQTSSVSVVTYTVDTHSLTGANTYTITNLTDGTPRTAAATNLTGSVTFFINPLPAMPTAPAIATAGTDAAGDILETNILGSTQVLAVQAGANATGLWLDYQNNPLTNSLAYLATNPVSGYYTNLVAAQLTNTASQCSGNAATVIQILVPPAPVSGGDKLNNVTVPNPALAVSTYTDGFNPAGEIVADWYSAASGGTLLASGTSSYTPTANTVGTNTYYAQARDVNSGLTSLARTAVNLILVTNICNNSYTTNTPGLITFDDMPLYASLTNGYGGLDWITVGTPFYYEEAVNYLSVSPPNALYVVTDGAGNGLSITNNSGFNFLSAYLSGMNDSGFLNVMGYTNGTLAYSNQIMLANHVFTNYQFNFTNVNRVDLLVQSHYTFLLDNVLLTNLPPVIVTNVGADCSAVPSVSPVSLGSQTNCAGVANPPLVVSVPVATQTINWFADATGTNLMAWNVATNGFTPTNAAPGAYTFYAQAVATNGYVSAAPFTPVTLTLLDCLGTNATISLLGGTNVSVSWFGNLKLQGTTNLAPPVNWVDIFTNPVVGWTNILQPTTNPPIEFFRVSTP